MGHHAFEWCGFIGAWLLVAGPLSQAALELADEEFEREDLERLTARIEAPPPVSRWWWLIPPVAYILRLRRRDAYHRRVVEVASQEELEPLLHFRETAAAWGYVSAGAFLIAIKETSELRDAYEWSRLGFWGVVALMWALCALSIRVRSRRRSEMLAKAGKDETA